MSVLQRAAVIGIATLLAATVNANATLFTYSYVGVVFGENDVGGLQGFNSSLGETGTT